MPWGGGGGVGIVAVGVVWGEEDATRCGCAR